MSQFMFRFLSPLLFFLAVVLYFGDFRLISIAVAVTGVGSFLISEELQPKR
jgi:hypothetical protein